jgi:hypothetical protein
MDKMLKRGRVDDFGTMYVVLSWFGFEKLLLKIDTI